MQAIELGFTAFCLTRLTFIQSAEEWGVTLKAFLQHKSTPIKNISSFFLEIKNKALCQKDIDNPRNFEREMYTYQCTS